MADYWQWQHRSRLYSSLPTPNLRSSLPPLIRGSGRRERRGTETRPRRKSLSTGEVGDQLSVYSSPHIALILIIGIISWAHGECSNNSYDDTNREREKQSNKVAAASHHRTGVVGRGKL